MIGVLQTLITIYIVVLFVRALLSWLPQGAERGVLGQVNKFTLILTEPVLAPVRRVIPPVRVGAVGIDVSFLVVLIALVVIRALL